MFVDMVLTTNLCSWLRIWCRRALSSRHYSRRTWWQVCQTRQRHSTRQWQELPLAWLIFWLQGQNPKTCSTLLSSRRTHHSSPDHSCLGCDCTMCGVAEICCPKWKYVWNWWNNDIQSLSQSPTCSTCCSFPLGMNRLSYDASYIVLTQMKSIF